MVNMDFKTISWESQGYRFERKHQNGKLIGTAHCGGISLPMEFGRVQAK
jgi:hypothetical protein